MTIETTVHPELQQHPTIQSLEETLSTRVGSLFHALGLTDPELSVVFTTNAFIAELNATWRGEPRPTDVLSFPLWEADEIRADVPALGDIVISVEYAQKTLEDGTHRARVAAALDVALDELSWTLEHELEFLFVHGLLHLVGYDHDDPEAERVMKLRECELFRLLRPVS